MPRILPVTRYYRPMNPAPRPLGKALAFSLIACLASAADRFPAKGGEIVITPIVHASVQIEFGGKVIQVDPWGFGGLKNAKPADLFLISDDVGHHLDPKAIAQLRKPGAPVIMPASGKALVPDGVVLANGESKSIDGILVEAIAAYDLKPGAPEHPKGEANGYVVTLGGKRILLAGVTECIPEVRALRNIDIAFLPLNIPPERMAPDVVAECAKSFKPKVLYVYHYDQDFASHAINGPLQPKWIPPGTTVAQTLVALKEALKGSGTELRSGQWYP
jgi:L-ascorbate metabolism protein UlaG (beta-lactamase superfamily)